MNNDAPTADSPGMPYLKALLLSLFAGTCLGGCVYDEYDAGYDAPRRAYHGGYVQRDVIVESRPGYYYEGGRYYRNEERYNRGRYGSYDRSDDRRSDWDDRQRREYREESRVHDNRESAEDQRKARERAEEARVKSYRSNTDRQRIEREKKEEEKVRGYREAFARQQEKQRQEEKPNGQKKKKKKDKDD